MALVEIYQDICEHSNINENGLCLECGLEINGLSNGSYFDTSSSDNNTHVYKNTINFTYEKDLENMNLPDIIKQEIIDLCGPNFGITRQKPRLRLLFSFAYKAYIKNNIPFQPNKLAKIIGLDNSDINEAMKLVSGLSNTKTNDSFSVPMCIISPMEFIEDIIKTLENYYKNLKLDVNEYKNLLELALKHNKLLYENNPNVVAVGIIKYNLDLKKIKTPKFHEAVSLNPSSIKNMTKQISLILDPLLKQ
jgi:hypothetical protein